MYGNVTFEHVVVFQLKCMMGNQFDTMMKGIVNQTSGDIMRACLRLGWNDAFRHTGRNVSKEDLSKKIDTACFWLVNNYMQYAAKKTTEERVAYIEECLAADGFLNLFRDIKKDPPTFGQIQKMFSMTTKLLLCLILTEEHLKACGLEVVLDEWGGRKILFQLPKFPEIAFDTADCPVDGVILRELGHSMPWSKISTADYLAVQEEIGTYADSRLRYDFETWR